MDATQLLRIIHISSGFTALLIGLIPMFSEKGGKVHVQTGRIYVIAMSLVFLTALPMSYVKSNIFLFSIAIFSYYLCFTAWRMVRRKNESPSAIDKIAMVLTLLTSIGMGGFGLYYVLNNLPEKGIVLLVFGMISLIMSAQDGRSFFLNKESKRYGKRAWFFGHIARIGGSYIATFTAFAVTNLGFWPMILNWLLPTVIGTILITRVSRKYYKKFLQQAG